MPLEVFVRGALCVAYSYQCLSSDPKWQSTCQCRSEHVVTPLELGHQPVLADAERGNTMSQAVLEITRDHITVWIESVWALRAGLWRW